MRKVLCALLHKGRVFAFAMAVTAVWTGFGESVTNVRGQQRENSKLVDIYYDLNAFDGGTYAVEVAIEGRTDEVTAATFSGAVGKGISPGKNHRIVWDSGVDWHGKKGDVKVIVTARIEDKGQHGRVQLWKDGPFWATTNIGANNPWDYGLYFWWGDTTGHLSSGFNFDSQNCPTHGKSPATLRSEGWVTEDGVLAPNHDAAHVRWGGGWRMPTYQEVSDISSKCNWTSKTVNGVNGYIVRGRGDYASNSIFLPCAGVVIGPTLNYFGTDGWYWSSAPHSVYSGRLYFHYSGEHFTYNDDRNARAFGQSIRPVQGSTMTGSSDWFCVNTTDKADVVIHFNANGGVFRDKDGNEVTQFDQYFTYGEAQRLFTDELTPMKMDANGNQFVGWVRESPEVTTGSSIVAAREERTWYEHDGVTEVTYYAVWTTTVTVSFYNEKTTGGDMTLSPASLADHLKWGVYNNNGWHKSGESVQVSPGERIVYFNYDNDYDWIIGTLEVDNHALCYNPTSRILTLDIRNDYDDGRTTPHEQGLNIHVKVGLPTAEGEVVFWHSCAVREKLRNLINSQRGNLPDFDPSKVRISIGRVEFNPAGNDYIPAKIGVLTGLELYKFYCLPVGLYYLKDVTYDTDTSSGDPYWGALLGSTSARLKESRLIQLRNDDDELITEYTIDFDVFGGANVARAVFDSREGECAKSEAWFPNSAEGIRVVSEKALPKPERAGFRFMGWFTKESGGLEFKEGVTIASDKVRRSLPDDLGAFDYTFKVYAQWTDMTDKWVNELFPDLVFDQNGNLVTLAKTTAANGKLTVAQCYSCGVNPTDPDDDFKVTHFEMKDGKPMITLNHTEDGSGNSFLPRVKTLGKADLSDAEWREVPEEGDDTMRFFKVEVEMP